MKAKETIMEPLLDPTLFGWQRAYGSAEARPPAVAFGEPTPLFRGPLTGEPVYLQPAGGSVGPSVRGAVAGQRVVFVQAGPTYGAPGARGSFTSRW